MNSGYDSRRTQITDYLKNHDFLAKSYTEYPNKQDIIISIYNNEQLSSLFFSSSYTKNGS